MVSVSVQYNAYTSDSQSVFCATFFKGYHFHMLVNVPGVCCNLLSGIKKCLSTIQEIQSGTEIK